ncbi:MAG: hypothetical protein ACO2O2_17790 [Acidilobaceae archaeon]
MITVIGDAMIGGWTTVTVTTSRELLACIDTCRLHSAYSRTSSYFVYN